MKNNNHDFYKGIIIGGFIIFFIIFAFILGLKLGRQDFNFYRFSAPFHPFLIDKKNHFVPKKFRNHGLIGVVESVGKNSFIVKNRWNELITIIVDNNTEYKKDSLKSSFSDIKKGKNVFIIGEPNIEKNEPSLKAKIVRIFD